MYLKTTDKIIYTPRSRPKDNRQRKSHEDEGKSHLMMEFSCSIPSKLTLGATPEFQLYARKLLKRYHDNIREAFRNLYWVYAER